MLTAEELNVLFEGIKLNKVNHYDYILTGESELSNLAAQMVCGTAEKCVLYNVSFRKIKLFFFFFISPRLQQGHVLPGDGG